MVDTDRFKEIKCLKVKHEHLRRLEGDVLGRSIQLAPKLNTKGAYRHIRLGLILRLTMMETSRFFIYDKIHGRGETPLGTYETSDINVHVNAFYLNLRGAFDNLVWATTYELELIVDIDEGQSKHRNFVNIAGKQFLTALAITHSESVSEIKKYHKWIQEIKDLRDPAAHRIPLFVPHGILHDGNIEHYNMLRKKAEQAASMKDFHSYASYLDEAKSSTTFLPNVMVTEGDETDARPVIDQMISDQWNFLELTRIFLYQVLGVMDTP